MTNGASASGGPIAVRRTLRLWTLTAAFGETKDVVMAQLRNLHPGEILKEEFLDEIGMSQNQLAHAIGVQGNRSQSIVNGTSDITGNTDLRLASSSVYRKVTSCGRTLMTRWRPSVALRASSPRSSPTRQDEACK
jgi:addiction module HigA family antidote